MYLKDISVENLQLFTKTLQRDDAWRKVAEGLGMHSDIDVVRGTDIVQALMDRNKTVEMLKDILFDLKLYDAWSYISGPEPVRIIREPYCVKSEDCFCEEDELFVKEGGKLHLKIDVVGFPMPTFQWLRDNNNISLDRDLIVSEFREEHQGTYHCRLHQHVNFGSPITVISEDIAVKIKIHKELPVITSHFPTEPCRIEYGQQLYLTVKVPDHVKPTYIWRHNDEECEEKWWSKNFLQIDKADESHSGKYKCLVKNKFGEDSREFIVEVKEKRPLPSEKRALIISICDYDQVEDLASPHDDAKILCSCLSEANFKCTMLGQGEILTAKQLVEGISKFFQTLKEGAYVLVYFAGHGFMANNTAYLVAYDGNLCSANSEIRDTECEANINARSADQTGAWHSPSLLERGVVCERILEEVLKYKPLFFVYILDMCLRIPNFQLKPEEREDPYEGNVIRCYATSPNSEALEGKHSVYVKNLVDIIHDKKDLTFDAMIKEVSKRVEKETNKRQTPMTIIGSGEFRISDPVRTV